MHHVFSNARSGQLCVTSHWVLKSDLLLGQVLLFFILVIASYTVIIQHHFLLPVSMLPPPRQPGLLRVGFLSMRFGMGARRLVAFWCFRTQDASGSGRTHKKHLRLEHSALRSQVLPQAPEARFPQRVWPFPCLLANHLPACKRFRGPSSRIRSSLCARARTSLRATT
jgi:hypothetical protein